MDIIKKKRNRLTSNNKLFIEKNPDIVEKLHEYMS